MAELDTSKWKPIGKSSNSDYFEIEPRVLAAVPRKGEVDTQQSARDNLRVQHEYMRARHGAVVMVFFDRLSFQEKEARTVYAEESDPSAMLGSALIGGTGIARTLASFFMTLFKPKVPTKMFPDYETALPWARELIAAAERRPAA